MLTILTALLAFIVFRNRHNKQDEVQKAYVKFLNKLKKYKLDKLDSEGAANFCERIIKKFPQHKNTVERITLYINNYATKFTIHNN